MQVIRFYGLEGDDIHVLAKFVTQTDVPETKFKEYAQFLVSGVHNAPDAVDFFNSKFFDLSERMQDDGFIPVDVLSLDDHDANCKRTFDFAVDRDARVVKLLVFEIHPSDKPPFYAKHLVDSGSYGMLS